jgi:hypothetical protein
MRLRCVSAARHEADLTRSAGECFQEHVHFFEGETTLERHGLLAADLPGCTFGQLVNERCARAALAPNESVQQPRALLVVRTDGGVGRSASRLASRCSLGCSPLAQSAISSRVHKRQQAVERESRHVDAPSEGVYSLNLQAPSWLSSKMVPKRGRCGSSAVEG